LITVHHLNNSRSQRVLWLLEEMGLEYEIRRYRRDPKTMLAPASLREIHPLGKSPVITDGDLTLAESGAIIEYLVDKYGQGRFAPARGTPERTRYTYWLHYAEGSAMPPLLLKLVFTQMPKAPMPALIRPIVRRVARGVQESYVDPQIAMHLDYLESEIAKSLWFAGREFTAADVQMSFPIEAAASRGGLDDRRPHLFGYLGRIRARPAYQRAIERGGPYELLQ
jgi:glutathione S-transferase